MRRTLLALVVLATAAGAEDDLQTRLFRARDRVLPALINVQPVLDVYSGGRRRQSTAIGSGVILSEDGLAVTNFHVAGHAKKIFVTLADKTRIPAKLLGGDPSTDLAVLRIDVNEVKRLGGKFGVAKLGAVTEVQVGEFVTALGSPRGLSMSLTTGVVSNKGRFLSGNITLPTGELTGMYNTWIQTDAAINPGNSGGPLVNMEGRVIGINTRAIRGGDGLGFAIPADVVQRVFTEIVDHGYVIRGWVGLDRGLEPLALDSKVKGVRIGHVDAESPASQAGLRPGDIILRIGGREMFAHHLDEIPPIRRAIADSPVGKPLTMVVLRGGKVIEIQVVPQELAAKKADQFDAKRFGLTARVITERYARQRGLGSTEGVLVTGVVAGKAAASAGVRSGDIILKVGKSTVWDLDAFRVRYRSTIQAQTKTVLLSIKRGRQKLVRVLTPAKKDDEEDE
ncbi:MAG: trypsin-like peptidase domain-containing protein [Planctomycetota bacterium]|nr:trypsin-like peptidase domain-containing protein [Planctomycetota bacterium]